jgi:signal transduction histidine kinase
MIPTRRHSRRIGSAGRLASLHAIVLALVLGAVVVALVRSFSTSYEAAAAADIGGRLKLYQQDALARPSSENLRTFSYQFLQTHPLAPGDSIIIALVGSGLVVTGNSAPLIHDPTVSKWFVQPPSSTVAHSATVGGIPLEIVAAPIRAGTSTIGTYIAAGDLRPFVAERSRVLLLSLAEAGVALLIGVASAFFLLRRLLRTVGRITDTAGEIGSGALDQRLGNQGSTDEVGELAQTFDTMLDRLETAMQAQRRLLSDVSHQLRTPLTVARGHLEILARTGVDDHISVRETLDLVIDELDHMARLIERLLMLGRAMEPDLIVRAPIELTEFLSSMIDSVAILAPRRFILTQIPEIVLLADREQLRGAIVNLLDNAIHATLTDDAIALGAEFDPGSGEIRIIVEDSGGGIPTTEREAVLQRFARPGARDADGSGLGLAIAREVAVAHGGSISIDQSPTLRGARVALVFPRASTRSMVAS